MVLTVANTVVNICANAEGEYADIDSVDDILDLSFKWSPNTWLQGTIILTHADVEL